MILEDKENNNIEESPIENNEDVTSSGPVFEDTNVQAEPHQEVVDPKKGKKKKSKARNIFEWVFTGIFALLFIAFGAGQIDGMIHKNEHHGQMIRFGFSSFVVWTDSMVPVYPVDSAIITYLEDEQTIIDRFNNGETVDLSFVNAETYPDITPTVKPIGSEEDPYAVYYWPVTTGRVMTHRLVEIQNKNGVNYFITAGINYSDGDYSKMGQYQVCTYSYVVGVVKVGSPFLGGIYNFISSPFGLLVLLLVPALYLAITSIIDILKTLKEAEEAPAVENKNKNTSTTLDGISKKDKERLKQEMLEEMIRKKKEKKDNEK